jgi:hypothetical protein
MGLNANPAQIQSVTIPTRLNSGAGMDIALAMVTYSMAKFVELFCLQVEEVPIKRSCKVGSTCAMMAV